MNDTANYAALFLNDVPLMDTRAPVEFARGSMPGAINLPLMSDEERAAVGTCYKERGQAAAIELGHKLVRNEVKYQRVRGWLEFARANPGGYLYCFRGGLRSQICQQWMHDAGCEFPRVLGGYKAMRHFLLETLEEQCGWRQLVVVAGHTGAAKTELLQQLPNSIDLEGLAHHRGSAFGKRPGGQPTQIDFENSIAVGLLKQAHRASSGLTVVEDESHLIGRLALPEALRRAMDTAPVVRVESSLEQRVEHTYENYILDALRERQAEYGEHDGFAAFANHLRESLYNIRRRLGGARYAELSTVMESAIEAHGRGNAEAHLGWIETLLQHYYDPMYEYQISSKKARVIFSGPPRDVREYLLRCGDVGLAS
ncbi:tRNA 2-selenouridine(34) synthase MnmH [Haliea sp. E17]|uniref:tRNA 2-selenouridine(34) synthase MnmH n=1 Tax=Haliea sp. E17 TaxID=3401576 RepID=UPI003AAF3312